MLWKCIMNGRGVGGFWEYIASVAENRLRVSDEIHEKYPKQTVK